MIATIRRMALGCCLLSSVALASFAQTTGKSIGNYTYDASGNVESIGPDSDGLTNLYEYDAAGRLLRFIRKNVSTGVVAVTETFEYDAYGNLTKQTTNGTATNLNAVAETNRLSNATYDAAGNMLAYGAESYTFDPVGTLTQKSGSWGNAFYVYTADDERIGIEGRDGTWRYMGRDLDGKVLREWSAVNGNAATAWTWAEDYIYRDGQLAAAVRPDAQGGVRHFHLDHLSSPRLITSSTANVYAEHAYYPYGREITSPTQELALGHDTPEPMKFTGHERDFAGSATYTGPVLDYMHARYYNPQSGRFLSVDPVLDVKRALRSPQMWNRYSYVVNNPLNRIDPDGRLVQLVGTDDERKKALELIKANLREQDRKYVTMNKNGVLSVDSKAKGGLGLSMLRDLTQHKATVNVSLGLTATAKAAPGPSRTSVIDLQAAAGGGVTLRPWQATSGTFEVHVDPRGNLQFGASPGLVMGHELLGHAWDLMFTGTSSERSAVTTETNLLFQLGLPQFRPVPTDEERP